MKKLTYAENIGLNANCPEIVKSYTTKTALFEDYERFKETWMEIARHNPTEYSIDEFSEAGIKAFALSTHIGGVVVTRTVSIQFEEE